MERGGKLTHEGRESKRVTSWRKTEKVTWVKYEGKGGVIIYCKGEGECNKSKREGSRIDGAGQYQQQFFIIHGVMLRLLMYHATAIITLENCTQVRILRLVYHWSFCNLLYIYYSRWPKLVVQDLVIYTAEPYSVVYILPEYIPWLFIYRR